MSVGGAKLLPLVGAGVGGAYAYSNGLQPFLHFCSDLSKALIDGAQQVSSVAAANAAAASNVPLNAHGLPQHLAVPGSLTLVGSGRGTDRSTYYMIIAGAGVGYVILKLSGIGLSEVVWVTRSTFRRGVEHLATGLDSLGKRLQHVRQVLSDRLDFLSARQEEAIAEQAALRAAVDKIGDDVTQVKTDVSGVHASVINIEDKIDDIQKEQKFGNRGIHLLCGVVSEALAGGARPDAVSELREFAGLPPLSASPSSERKDSAEAKRLRNVFNIPQAVPVTADDDFDDDEGPSARISGNPEISPSSSFSSKSSQDLSKSVVSTMAWKSLFNARSNSFSGPEEAPEAPARSA